MKDACPSPLHELNCMAITGICCWSNSHIYASCVLLLAVASELKKQITYVALIRQGLSFDGRRLPVKALA